MVQDDFGDMGFSATIEANIRDALYRQGVRIGNLFTSDQVNALVHIVAFRMGVHGGSLNASTEEINRVRAATVGPGEDLVDLFTGEIILPTNGGPEGLDVREDIVTTDQLTLDELRVLDLDSLAPNISLASGAFTVAQLVAGALLAAAGRVPGGATVVRFASRNPIRLLLGIEAIDVLTPSFDLPSPSDIPGAIWALLRGGGGVIADTAVGTVVTLAEILDQFIDIPGIGSGMDVFRQGQIFNPGEIVKTWTANGVAFARLADGRTVVRRKDGTFKIYRQPKPLVIMPGGASNLRQLVKVNNAVVRQLRTLKKAIARAEPRIRKVKVPVAVPAGTSIINVD